MSEPTTILDPLDIMFIEVKAMKVMLSNNSENPINLSPTDDDYRLAIRQIFEDDPELTDAGVDILLGEIKTYKETQVFVKQILGDLCHEH